MADATTGKGLLGTALGWVLPGFLMSALGLVADAVVKRTGKSGDGILDTLLQNLPASWQPHVKPIIDFFDKISDFFNSMIDKVMNAVGLGASKEDQTALAEINTRIDKFANIDNVATGLKLDAGKIRQMCKDQAKDFFGSGMPTDATIAVASAKELYGKLYDYIHGELEKTNPSGAQNQKIAIDAAAYISGYTDDADTDPSKLINGIGGMLRNFQVAVAAPGDYQQGTAPVGKMNESLLQEIQGLLRGVTGPGGSATLTAPANPAAPGVGI